MEIKIWLEVSLYFQKFAMHSLAFSAGSYLAKQSRYFTKGLIHQAISNHWMNHSNPRVNYRITKALDSAHIRISNLLKCKAPSDQPY